jgi:cation:H+ antiporter
MSSIGETSMSITLLIAGGLLLLSLGGEAVVRGAVGAARRLGVSELLIGLTLVGFGTSTPELITSINAALAGSPGIAVGNVVGSNISNALLIFATVALISPVAVDPAALRRDGSAMIGATLLLTAVGLSLGMLSRPVGLAFVALLVAYLLFVWRAERSNGPSADLHTAEGHSHDPVPAPLWQSLLIAAAGLAGLMLGADLLVRGAIDLARLAGLSETVIGLTIVAIGTSLPELVASLTAALRGRSGVAFGNIVGSNIYNILGILGLTALVQPVPIPADIVWRDWIAVTGATVILVFHAWTGARVGRWEGASLLALYGLYAWFLFGAGSTAGAG